MTIPNFRFYTIVVLLLGAFFISACKKDKTVPYNVASGECTDVISYTTDIRPIIEASCKTGIGPGTGCHDAWIDNYDPIKSYLVSGKWQTAVLIDKTMPKIPNSFGIDSLSPADFKTMKCWIDQGYPQN